MKIRRFAALVLAAAALTVPSCMADEYGILIRGLTNPADWENDCVWSVASGADVFKAIGRIDLSFSGARYLAGVQVYNNLVESTPNTSMMSMSAIGTLHLDANAVVPRRAYGRIRSPDEANTGAAFGEYEWSAEITGDPITSAKSADMPGSGVVLFELIPNGVIANLLALDPNAPFQEGDPPARAMVDFYLEFSTISGDTVYSSTFTYAMEICFGCLNGMGRGSLEEGCDAEGEGCDIAGNLCSPGQDAATYCSCI
ncbi:MAG: hypothetical protein HY897_25830 [Deltaproteobacteria bacterium]|nr:hypothetical protein [Deltaproteobacteria bacterium]